MSFYVCWVKDFPMTGRVIEDCSSHLAAFQYIKNGLHKHGEKFKVCVCAYGSLHFNCYDCCAKIDMKETKDIAVDECLWNNLIKLFHENGVHKNYPVSWRDVLQNQLEAI
jgi:hypothetical protein